MNQLKKAGKYDEGGGYTRITEGATISKEQGFLGFTAMDKEKFHYKEDFVKKFNNAIYDMKKNGEIQNIVDRFTSLGLLRVPVPECD